MKIKKIILFVCGIIFVIILIFLLNNNKEIYTISDFITEHKLMNAEIIDLEDKSYIFSEDKIYVYRGKSNYEYSFGNKVGNYTVGGLEKGSIGVIVDDERLSHNINNYLVILDGQEGPHKQIIKKGKNMVIFDKRIWNPNPNFTIKFFDLDNKVIGSLDM